MFFLFLTCGLLGIYHKLFYLSTKLGSFKQTKKEFHIIFILFYQYFLFVYHQVFLSLF